MTVQLQITDESGLVLWIGPDNIVQVPLKPSDRQMCRQAIIDAMALLDETEVTQRLGVATAPMRPVLQLVEPE